MLDGIDSEASLMDPKFWESPIGRDFLQRHPQAARDLQVLITKGGLRIRRDAWMEMEGQRFRRAWDRYRATKNVPMQMLNLPFSMMERLQGYLFEKYVPGLKIGAVLREFELARKIHEADIASGKMTEAQLARQTVNFIEDRFGEMNYSNLWWDRNLKSALQIVVRSPTWRLGSLRAFVGAAKDTAQVASALAKGESPTLTPRMAWALFAVPVVHATMSALVQQLFTGEPPQTFKDVLFPRYDKNDDRKRFNMPTYMKDYYHFAKDWVGYSTAGLSYIPGVAAAMMRNKTYFGEKIYDESLPFGERLIASAKAVAPKPFSYQTFTRLRQAGETPLVQAASFLGLTKAPISVSETKAEALMSEYHWSQEPVAGHTKEQARAIGVRRSVRRAMERGDMKEAVKLGLEATKTGDMSLNTFNRMLSSQGQDPRALDFKGLPTQTPDDIRRLIEVMKVATPEERILFQPIYMQKISGLARNNPGLWRRFNKELMGPIAEHHQSKGAPPAVAQQATPML
jgi:hypothetical protein